MKGQQRSSLLNQWKQRRRLLLSSLVVVTGVAVFQLSRWGRVVA